MTPAQLTTHLRTTLLEEGFDAVGISRAGNLDEADGLETWLRDGRNGEMVYMTETAKRRDPSLILPGIRSVVSAGMSYWNPDPAAPSDATGRPAPSFPPSAASPTGRIARYARGSDYHNVMGKKLRRLMKRWRAGIPGLDGRWYVDTGPVMDKAWAARAGVGWYGRHTNLVSREHGSWLLLGTILLNQELEHDPAHQDFCGSCRRCIDACPTAAITAAHEIDARLCISYLTIEHRGSIPVELRPKMGGWIFGCDLCLDVCPWNRFARESREAKFKARADRAAPELLPLLELTEPEFRSGFEGSPVRRARRDGFVRNVAVALGNTGGGESLAPLRHSAEGDASELVREHAAWAVSRVTERLKSGRTP